MSDSMVDIESLGTKPGCIILSIGACKFDPRGYGSDKYFYQNIDPESCRKLGMTSDPSTVEWWLKQDEAAKKALVNDRVSIKTALQRFSTWFEENTLEKIWCQGATFDAPILERAFQFAGIETPWKFWNVRDTRTAYDICKFDPYSIDRKGTYHNALDDAKHQVTCVQSALSEVL